MSRTDTLDDTEPSTDAPTTAAIYCRVSTADQDTESQVEVCTDHARNHPDIDEWTVYSDVQSGHDDDREDYVRLKADIRDGQYDYFICSEFSRISRNDGEIKTFIADCFDREMGVEVVQSSFSVEQGADPISRQAMKMVADTLANIATMEQLQKIDRINRGIQHAREAGTWTGKSPKGFEVNDDGYLEVKEEEFLRIRTALLDHHYKGTSWSALEDELGLNRSTLSRYYSDDEKFELYTNAKGYDDHGRIEAALKDADMKTYIESLDDRPDTDDSETEGAAETPTEVDVDADERALVRTMLDVFDTAQQDAADLSEAELLELYEENRSTVADTLTSDD